MSDDEMIERIARTRTDCFQEDCGCWRTIVAKVIADISLLRAAGFELIRKDQLVAIRARAGEDGPNWRYPTTQTIPLP